MGLIFNGNGDVIRAVDGSLTVEGIDLGGSTNIEAGIGTFSGNLNVGGVLTYEDVKNVDSVGIVTARDGLRVTGGTSIFTGNATVGGNLDISDTIYHTGDSNTKIRFPANDTITLHTSGDERLRIASDGNVGITTTAPLRQLHIHNSSSAATSVRFTHPSVGGVGADVGISASGDIALWHNNDNKNLILGTNNAERLRIASDGKVGINETTPERALDVNGDILANAFMLKNNSSPSGSIQAQIYRAATNTLAFATNGANERLRIDSSGRVLIGTTDPGSGNADELTLAGSGSSGLTIRSGTSNTGSIFFSDATSGAAQYAGAVEFNHNDDELKLMVGNSPRVTITSGGIVDVTGKLRVDIATGGTVGSGNAEGIFLRNTQETDNNAVTIFGGADDYNTAASAINFVNVDHSANYGAISFDTRGSGGYGERVRITSGGVLCVGATAADGDEFLRVKNKILVMNTANLGDAFVKIKAGESGGSILEFEADEGDDYADLWRIQNAGDGLLGFRTKASGSWVEKLRIATDGQVTIGGQVHIGSKLVHDGDTDTNIDFGTNSIVLKAGNRTAINCNSTMTEISSPVQYNNARNYTTNSNSTWQTICTFSTTTPGFSMECGVRENNYTTIHRVSGSAQWNNCYYTSDFAGDSGHAHSSDIMFRVLNDSGTKRLQFKAVSYTTTRVLSVISIWVASGYVTWA